MRGTSSRAARAASMVGYPARVCAAHAPALDAAAVAEAVARDAPFGCSDGAGSSSMGGSARPAELSRRGLRGSCSSSKEIA